MKLNNLFWYDLLTFIKEEKRRLMKIVRANFSLGYISSKSFDEYYRVALERNDIKIIDDLLTKVTSLDTQK